MELAERETERPIESSVNFDRGFRPKTYSLESLISRFEREANLRGLRPKTIHSYSFSLRTFFQETGLNPETATVEKIQRYVSRVSREKKLSASSQNLLISALRFFFIKVTKTFINLDLERPFKLRNYPEILTKDEVQRIIDSAKTLKHKAILTLIYSSGLRVSEAVELFPSDLDIEKRFIRVRSIEPQRQRMTLLSDFDLSVVEKYLSKLGNPKFLFPGQDSLNSMSIRSAEKIFEVAKIRAGIQKKVSIHSLRHSYANQLLSEGTSLKLLQFLLGHKNLQTTQFYAEGPWLSYAKVG
ncbi:MAG: tyrosine-type recombinase/integrase [Leptospiraceae bacterium]|nr:tyrosine-type recombinase/integrase [Leptospiraceae bacterium]